MQILIRIPVETKEFLRQEADRIGITLNALMLIILDEWMKQQKEQNVSESDTGKGMILNVKDES